MRSTVVVTAALLGLVVACGGDNGTNVTADVTVGSGGNTFNPQTLTLSTKRAVTWTWAGPNHNVTWEDGATASATQSSGSFRRDFTSATAGTYRYRCTVHSSPGNFTSGMVGSVVVP